MQFPGSFLPPLSRLWNRLTDPAISLPHIPARSQKQLSSLLVLTLVISVSTMVMRVINVGFGLPWEDPKIWLAAGLIVLETISYMLSRTRHYVLSMRLFLVTVSLGLMFL